MYHRYASSRRRYRRHGRRPRSFIKRVLRKAKRRLFKSRIKRVIQSVAETKTISQGCIKTPYTLQSTSGNNALWNSTLILTPCTGADNTNFLGYNVQQGTADGYRIGNKIRIKKAYLNVTLNALKQNAATNPYPAPQEVRLYFWRKKVNANNSPTGTELFGTGGNFFQAGTSQSGFTGMLQDFTLDVNRDQYVLLKTISHKIGYQTYNGTGTNTDQYSQYFSNNDFKLNMLKKINITKLLPKQFMWNDQGVVVTPYTFCTIQTVRADGSLANVLDQPLNWVADTVIQYTDV